MTLTIEITPEMETRLREEAAKAGMDANEFILNTLQDRLRCKATRTAKQPLRLPKEENDLLLEINERLPEETRQEYYALVAKRRAETLTPEKHIRLITLTDTVEIKNAERIAHLAETCATASSLAGCPNEAVGHPPTRIHLICACLRTKMRTPSGDAAMTTATRATIDDLYKIDGKAELVNGEILLMSPTGAVPGYAGDEIYASLREYVRRHRYGRAVSDNKGFRVNLPNRESFSPDAAFHTGPSTGMRYYNGAPVFAVEVRSEGDYGPAAERDMEAKRQDYFAAGTLVVWDVDLLSADVVKKYSAVDPTNPTVFRRGEIAEAEPAVPGWTMPVDDLFETP